MEKCHGDGIMETVPRRQCQGDSATETAPRRQCHGDSAREMAPGDSATETVPLCLVRSRPARAGRGHLAEELSTHSAEGPASSRCSQGIGEEAAHGSQN